MEVRCSKEGQHQIDKCFYFVQSAKSICNYPGHLTLLGAIRSKKKKKTVCYLINFYQMDKMPDTVGNAYTAGKQHILF